MATNDVSQLPQPTQSQLDIHIDENISDKSPHPEHLQQIALQIKHNLQYQHDWTNLTIHHYCQTNKTDNGNDKARARKPLPRPIISGLPPRRLYVHPEEQISMLQSVEKKGLNLNNGAQTEMSDTKGDEKQAGSSNDSVNDTTADAKLPKSSSDSAVDLSALANLEPEREWVLPTHLKEKWSLQRFGTIFDNINVRPMELKDYYPQNDLEEVHDIRAVDAVVNPWRTLKRVVLATLDDDSTVVYYIVHDGIVKPRQN